jgi:hypothetical protein
LNIKGKQMAQIAIKIFLTYTAISMTCGLAYGFVYGAIVGVLNTNFSVFLLLWAGPLGLAIAVGVPIGLWHLWKTDFR